MNDEKLALVLFDIGFLLMLASMVIGPFGINNWALTTAGIACCVALASIAIAFQDWDAPEEPTQVVAPGTDSEEKKRGDPAKAEPHNS